LAQSEQKKYEIDLFWLFISLLFVGASIWLGVNNSRLSKKDQQNIATQAVLRAQRDSLVVKSDALQEKIVLLEADVKKANLNTQESENRAYAYKKRYEAIQSIHPGVDTVTLYLNCDTLNQIYENHIEILKTNVYSYARLSDSLRVQTSYLLQEQGISTALITVQAEELIKVRGKLRRAKIFNWTMGGLLVGAVTIIAVQ
jgi:hypothetical protein